MTTIIIILAIWGIYRILKGTSERRQAERAERERQRIREEQAAQREEQRQMREAQREQARRQAAHAIALERARVEREELRKEQARQREEIEKLKHTIDQAQFDIDFLNERVGRIDIQTDYYITLQSATTPGGAEWWKYQKKIDGLKNQAHTVEKQISKAKFQKEQAERKLV